MSPKFCVHCGEKLQEVAKFCSGCGQKVDASSAAVVVSEPEVDACVFTRHKTNKYDNIKEDLRNHLDNHRIKDIRKYFAKGLELHFPEVLKEKLMGDDDEKGNFIFWEYRVATKYKGLHQLQEDVGWGNRDYAFLTENHLVLINDSINLMMIAKNKDLFKAIKWEQIDQIVVALDSYVEKGFVTLVEWHWRLQFKLTNGQVYERYLYIGMNEKGYNDNIDSSQNMIAQLAYLCAQKGKRQVIRFVEGSSTLNDFTPRFGYGVFKEIGD
jgi:hypothetical protein